MGRRYDIDWPPIEREFALNQLSVNALATKYGVKASTITRHCDALGIKRDPTDELRSRTNAALISSGSAECNSNALGNAKEKAQQRRDSIEEAVATNVAVLKKHQRLAGRIEAIAEILLEETGGGAEDLRSSEKPKNQMQRIQRAATVAKLADTLNTVATIFTKIVPVERQALNISDKADGDKTAADPKKLTDEVLDAMIDRLEKKGGSE